MVVKTLTAHGIKLEKVFWSKIIIIFTHHLISKHVVAICILYICYLLYVFSKNNQKMDSLKYVYACDLAYLNLFFLVI